jgi:hypothetical protein
MKKEIKDRESKKDFEELLVSFIHDYYEKKYQEILEIKNLPRKDIEKKDDIFGSNISVYNTLVQIINAYIVPDYFVYDRANNSILKYDGHTLDGEIIFYADQQEAIDDLYGNEEVCKFYELPEDKQEEIIKELNSRKF